MQTKKLKKPIKQWKDEMQFFVKQIRKHLIDLVLLMDRNGPLDQMNASKKRTMISQYLDAIEEHIHEK